MLVLRHQLNVLRCKSPKRLVFSNIDRLVFAGVSGLVPSVRTALKILKPATVIAWHRAALRAYWRWKSRARGDRPCASTAALSDCRVRSLGRERGRRPRLVRRPPRPPGGYSATTSCRSAPSRGGRALHMQDRRRPRCVVQCIRGRPQRARAATFTSGDVEDIQMTSKAHGMPTSRRRLIMFEEGLKHLGT